MQEIVINNTSSEFQTNNNFYISEKKTSHCLMLSNKVTVLQCSKSRFSKIYKPCTLQTAFDFSKIWGRLDYFHVKFPTTRTVWWWNTTPKPIVAHYLNGQAIKHFSLEFLHKASMTYIKMQYKIILSYIIKQIWEISIHFPSFRDFVCYD